MSTRTSPNVNNSLLIFSLLSCFVKKKYFYGNMGTYKNADLPKHNPLGSSIGGDPSKYT
jgi:hypothetical protein